MARSKVAQSQSRSKTQGKAAKAPAKPATFQRTGAPFDGDEGIRPDSTPADLFLLMFDAPNAGDNFLEQVICCAADDFELLNAAAQSDHGLNNVLARVAFRNFYRLKVAIEVNRRMQAARDPEVRS